jgi:predicted lipid-binding transport protein (Tim44 family)
VLKHLVAIAAVIAFLSIVSVRKARGAQDGAAPQNGPTAVRDNSGSDPDPENADDSVDTGEKKTPSAQNAAAPGKKQASAEGRPFDPAHDDDTQFKADYQRVQKACAAGKYKEAEKELDLLIQHRQEYYARRAKEPSSPSGTPASTRKPQGE